MGGGRALDLPFTPTWVVAGVCAVIITVSLAAERCLHFAGKYLEKKKPNTLYEALLKVKEELMLLGFISLVLTVCQSPITKICLKEPITDNWLPCNNTELHMLKTKSTAEHVNYCAKKGKVPLLSVEAFHQLHIFIFVLAVTHVTSTALTIVFGNLKIRQWEQWESVAKGPTPADHSRVVEAVKAYFIQKNYAGGDIKHRLKDWLRSFKNQFYGSVTFADYIVLRLGFVVTHSRQNLNYDFYKYMVLSLEDDFKRVVGIRWYLWVFVVIFMLLNVDGWNAYFWIEFIPFVLLLTVGTKLQHVICQMAHEVSQRDDVLEVAGGDDVREVALHEVARRDDVREVAGGDNVREVARRDDVCEVARRTVIPSDRHFWFHKPKFVLLLIHFILFQNAFQMAFFFWISVQYGFKSCMMGNGGYISPRLVIGAFVQFVCSYSTLPLYAIVTQMRRDVNTAIFNCAQEARNNSNGNQVEPSPV